MAWIAPSFAAAPDWNIEKSEWVTQSPFSCSLRWVSKRKEIVLLTGGYWYVISGVNFCEPERVNTVMWLMQEVMWCTCDRCSRFWRQLTRTRFLVQWVLFLPFLTFSLFYACNSVLCFCDIHYYYCRGVPWESERWRYAIHSHNKINFPQHRTTHVLFFWKNMVHVSLDLTTFALSARRSTDWANGPRWQTTQLTWECRSTYISLRVSEW